MKWKKKGKICDCNTFELEWYKTNTMTPIPCVIGDRLRIYLALCDAENKGRIGYIDVEKDDPSVILDYSKKPVLDVGEKGMFDEDGVLPSDLLIEDGKIYMYYSAYQKQIHIPYTIFSGLAVGNNNGTEFTRISNTPIFERTNGETFQRSGVTVRKIGKDKYRAWYANGIAWKENGGKETPVYDIRCVDSDKKDIWNGISRECVGLKAGESGLAMPQVWIENNYKMIYSIRCDKKGYRLGYAESEDGEHFNRLDEKMEIDVSEEGFDSEMLCFGKMIKVNKKVYLFYCGNHYGRGGLGYAELEDSF